ncbi:MAG: pseudouridine synthase [Planctomycetota bacterium]
MKQRLHKYIASCGYCSRRKAELLLQAGLVTVDGRKVEDLGFKIDPERSTVEINGEAIAPPGPLTVILNKPEGFITSTHDTHERLTVMDLLPKSVVDRGVLPAGRLDFETEGLLVFTNDGNLQHRITHPRYTCPKVYRATLDREPTDRELEKLRKGVFLEEVGKKTAEAEVEMVTAPGERPPICQVRISEGMKRQVRRMFETVRIRVVHLERRSIGGVELGELPRGGWRALTDEEIESLTPEE